MSTYAIGDIHGCYKALKTLIQSIPQDEQDTFVFLGDYVDKGPDSKKVLDYLIDFSRKRQSIFIQGNHEIMMLVAREEEERLQEWVAGGGNETLKSYDIEPKNGWFNAISDEHWEFIDSAKQYYEIDEFIFVHAGLESGIELADQNKNTLFWKKNETPTNYLDGKKVICGHTSRKNGEIAYFGHTICIDTYAHGGQWLTALDVTTGKYFQSNENGQIRSGTIDRSLGES